MVLIVVLTSIWAWAQKPVRPPHQLVVINKSSAPQPSAPATKSKTRSAKKIEPISAASPDHLKALGVLDKRYQSAKSVSMALEKTIVIGALEKEKKSKGRLTLSQGRMRMDIEEPDQSLVLIDGKTVWVVDYPSADFKDSPVQVMKGSVQSNKGASQSFMGLLARGGILKHFQVTAVQNDERGRPIFFLNPAKDTGEFKRAQMILSKDNKEIAELRYWDDRDNETRLVFSQVEFDKPINKKTFEFIPPPGAAISPI